jgi:protocatechuate 3,4-dioxygenase beta subunit
MTGRRVPIVRARAVPRREVLRGLGALAGVTPALAALSCSDERASHMSDAASNAGAEAAAPAGAGPAANSGGSLSAVTASRTPAAGTTSQAAAGSRSGASVQAGSGAGSASQAGAPAAGRSAAGSAAGSGGAAAISGTGGASVPAMFQDAASCTLTTTDIEGPFYIDEAEVSNDISMVRRDIRDGHAGVEFQLWFRMLDAKNSCMPIDGAELYIWHCDADGYYSGFDGQDPSKPYMGPASPDPTKLDRFCRGIQYSDASGIASFITIYPGWYAGRPLHVHLMARMKGATTRLITTQLYFPADFTQDVHSSEPAYMARAANIPAGSKNPPSGKPAMPTMKHTPGLVVGTLNVIVNG